MNAVLKIRGRDALAVWTLPYITSWRLSPDMLLDRLTGDTLYASEKFPTAFNLADNKTPISIPAAQWYALHDLMEKLEQDLTDNNLSQFKNRKAWNKQTIEEFWEYEPGYLWLDEFSQWYKYFTNNYWISEENENTDLCFNPKFLNNHAEYFKKHEKQWRDQTDNNFKVTPLDKVEKEEQENQANKKGWPTIGLEDFVKRILAQEVGEEIVFPALLKLLEDYDLVISDGVVNGQSINTDCFIKRLKEYDVNDTVDSDLWEILLIKERHYSIHRDDVAKAFNKAGKVDFPWLGLDEKLTKLTCDEFIEPVLNEPLGLRLNRAYAVRKKQNSINVAYSIEDLTENPILELLERRTIENDFERYFELFVWKDELEKELNRLRNTSYDDETMRKGDIKQIRTKIMEIDSYLDSEDNHPATKPINVTSDNEKKEQILHQTQPLDVNKGAGTSNLLEKGTDNNPLSVFKEMKDLKWNEVSICFTTPEDVTIKARKVKKRAKFNNFYTGIDTRNNNPTNVWECFRMLAICEQTNNTKSLLYQSIPDTKTTIKRVRKMLKESFDITSNPINYKYYVPVINLSIEEHVIKHLVSNTLHKDESMSDIEEAMNNEQY